MRPLVRTSESVDAPRVREPPSSTRSALLAFSPVLDRGALTALLSMLRNKPRSAKRLLLKLTFTSRSFFKVSRFNYCRLLIFFLYEIPGPQNLTGARL